jgi:DMSO/TMAO reductase YedYZ molybdopterin-dependent catalytic subunit
MQREKPATFIFLVIVVSHDTMSAKKLPPGQRETKRILRWGEDHPTISGFVPSIDLENWTLKIDGEIDNSVTLNWREFANLPMVVSMSDFHCVEGWSVLDCRWEGIRFKTIVDLVKTKSNAKYVTFTCEDNYTTSFVLDELLSDNVILAYKLDGRTLEPGLGFPVRLVVPNKYAYKSALWVRTITFTQEKELGFWEQRGFSDTADVWKNDRIAE